MNFVIGRVLIEGIGLIVDEFDHVRIAVAVENKNEKYLQMCVFTNNTIIKIRIHKRHLIDDNENTFIYIVHFSMYSINP